MLTFGPFVLIAIALLVAAYAVLDPTPPKRVVLGTGPENSAYAKWGELYAAELERPEPRKRRQEERGHGRAGVARHRRLRPGVDLLPRRVGEEARQGRARDRAAADARLAAERRRARQRHPWDHEPHFRGQLRRAR